MKGIIRKSALAAIAIALTLPANAQFGGLKGLAKKAKEKISSTVKDNSGVSNVVSNAGSVATGAAVARGEAPWPMNGKPTYKDKDLRQFLYTLADESEADVVAMREALYARFRENMKIIKAAGDGGNSMAEVAGQENKNFEMLYMELNSLIGMSLSGVTWKGGNITLDNPYRLVTSRQGGGVDGIFIIGTTKNEYRFANKDGSGRFLSDEHLNEVKDYALRFHRYQDLSYGLYQLLQETDAMTYRFGYFVQDYVANDYRFIYNRAGICANGADGAIAKNTPENIDRQPRPKAGSMNASMKAQALQIAKAEDKDVIDVIITSDAWDVKMRGLVPVNRNIYGYWLCKDAQGTICYSRMWTEDYVGNGKYGKLRAGGVGVKSPFYIK